MDSKVKAISVDASDVIRFPGREGRYENLPKVVTIKDIIKNLTFRNAKEHDYIDGEGVVCEVLKPGQDWQSGRLYLTGYLIADAEAQPEQLEESLETFRLED